MPIDALPTAPQPTDSTAVFKTKSFNHVAALATFTTQANALEANVTALEALTEGHAAAADVSRIAAQAAAAQAAAAAGVTKWISGTAYLDGQNVWSPINHITYRRRSAGSGTTDPSLDPANWALLSTSKLPTQRISTNTTAQWGMHYVFEAACTLTLPLPGANKDDVIEVSNVSGLVTCVVDFTTGKLRGQLPGAMTLIEPELAFRLQDVGDATIGYTALP